MPCKKKGFKKKRKRKGRGTSGRLFLLFMMFCLVTSMSLVNQDGNIVFGLTVTNLSYGFENTTATQQVTTLKSGFFTTYNVSNVDNTAVDTSFAYEGTKSYRVSKNGGNVGWSYWNCTIDESINYFSNISMFLYFSSRDINVDNFIIYMYDNDDVLLFELVFKGNNSALYMFYADHNGAEVDLRGNVDVSTWFNVWVQYNSNDSYDIGIQEPGEATAIAEGVQPRNVVDSPTFKQLRFWTNWVANTEVFWVDTFNCTFQDYPLWWPGVSGDITISVFNESNITQAVTNYDVYVKTIGGALLYSLVGQSNPVVIETRYIGTGERVFEIYNDSYFERYYIVNIVSKANHTLTAYLPPVSEAYLYYIKVQDSIESPLYQVYIQLSRNFNGTVSDIAQGYTDIFGLYPVYLLGGQQYGINLTKTGYDDFTGTFVTDPNSYGYNNPIIFELGYSVFNETVITINDVVHFNATIDDAGNIQVWYEDYYSNTTDTNITIYEYYNGTYTYNYSEERTGDNSFTFTDAGYNTSMMHYIILHVNHTDFSPNHQILYILLYPLSSGLADESVIEKYWTDVFGNWDLGWTKTLLVFLPCILFLCVFGPNHVGLGILGSSLYMGFATVMIDFGSSATAMFLFISSMVAVTGVVMIIAKKGKAAI